MVLGSTPRRGRTVPALLACAALGLALAAVGSGCSDPQPTAPPTQPGAEVNYPKAKPNADLGKSQNRRTPR